MIFGFPAVLVYAHIMLGLVNGAFYAVLSLGLAVIFGILGIINFTHGALYMMGAVLAWLLLLWLGVGYWPALILSPLMVGLFAALIERLFIARLYAMDHIYAFILTFGLALMIESLVSNLVGSSGETYPVPKALTGAVNLGFMILPIYRLWVVLASGAVCTLTWALIEKTRLGATLRAAAENGPIAQSLGVNVPWLRSMTFAAGAALAALAGVLAAPIYAVGPHMGSDVVIAVFAIVVIGGLGSIKGAIFASLALGLLEGLATLFIPNASGTLIFIFMALILLYRSRAIAA